MASNKLNKMETDAIRRRWQLGEPAVSLAENFEVSERQIRRICRGLPCGRPARRFIDVAEVTRLQADGHSYLQIAEILDFHRDALVRAVSRERARAAA